MKDFTLMARLGVTFDFDFILQDTVNRLMEKDQCVHTKFPFHFSAEKNNFSKGNHG